MKKIYNLILVFCVFLFSYQLDAGKKSKSHHPHDKHRQRQRRDVYESLQEQIKDLAMILKLTRLLNHQPSQLVTAPSIRRIIIDFSKQ